MTRSAGVLLYRIMAGSLEVRLVHPGGSFWRNKDLGAWHMPKGLIEPGEDFETATRREVTEEFGQAIEGPLIDLGEIRQAGGKLVNAFASARGFDPDTLVSNMVEIDWPHGVVASWRYRRSIRRGGSAWTRRARICCQASCHCWIG